MAKTSELLAEFRGLSDADLRQRVQALEEERFRLKFRAATETLEQPLRLRTVRRDIARCLTVLRERELEASAEARPSGTARRRANRVAGAAADRAAKRAARLAQKARKGLRSTARKARPAGPGSAPSGATTAQ